MIIDFSIRNPLLVNFLLFGIIAVGVLSWRAMPQEIFPVTEEDTIEITTRFDGSPPIEVERQITIPIEDAVEGLGDVDSIESLSRESYSQVLLTLKPNVGVDDFLQDVRSAVDAIEDLPEDADRTQMRRLRTRFPVLSVSVYGDAREEDLIETGKRVKRAIQKIEDVASVSIAGEREWELWVIFDPYLLAARKVALDEISRALKSNVGDRPGGKLSSNRGEIQLRGLGAAPSEQAVREIPIRSNASGGQLKIGDVADVELHLETEKTLGRFAGKSAINLVVTKAAGGSTIEVADAVKRLIGELSQTLPPDISLGYHSDSSVYIETRLQTVFSSGAVGLLLLLLSLYLLLNLRVAVITALGIPISFLVAAIAIYYLGFTVNMVSLFAFLIALGMIVDDAIIITENTYRHLEEGKPHMQAATLGAREVVGPVVASTLTTVAAFLPMFAVGGTLGAFITVIPIVVSAALLGSLFEAFVILPSHAHMVFRNIETKVQRTSAFWKKVLDRYARWLEWSLNRRYLVSVLAVCAFAVALALALTRVPFQLFGGVEINQFFVNIEAPNTYGMEDSKRLASEIETEIEKIFEGHEDELEVMLTNVGVLLIDFNRSKLASHYVQLLVTLQKRRPEGFIERFVTPLINFRLPSDSGRVRGTDEIIGLIRESLQNVPGVKRFSVLKPRAGPAGSDIVVGIAGADIGRLREYADEMSEFLQTLDGVYDVRHDVEPGKLEFRYRLNDRGRELGLTQETVADFVRAGYLGVEIAYANWGKERYPVRIIFPEEVRNDIAALPELPLTLSNGKVVYLDEVTDIELDRGFSTLMRIDRRRVATVSAEVDLDKTTALEIYDLLDERFSEVFEQRPDYEMAFRGERRDAIESFEGLGDAMIIAIVLIFFILIVLFRSLLEPLVVLSAIPFGIVGVIAGHLLFGFNLQFVSMVGFVALSGIIVNDSLILVNFVSKRRAQGDERIAAVIGAGRKRARPILLTTVTTFLGVSPLIFFATGQTAFLSPMAISLGFGLVFATALILLVLPCFYLVADDLRLRIKNG